MIVLHIACTNGDMCNGVQVVVPQHLNAQSRYAKVAFINISNIKIKCECEQFKYTKSFSIKNLKKPFDRPDIVVFHECYRISYIKISKELEILKIPYIIIPHGELSSNAQKKKILKKKIANLLIFNRFVNHAAGVQFLSEIESQNTNFKCHKFVATNGINIPGIRKEHFNKYGIKFIYIGRLDVYHKGLDLMIEGVSKCAHFLRENSCIFDIYGPDILGRLEQVKNLIEENKVEDIVKLHGPIFGKEKEKIILESDIFIQTSRFEGMPMGILEALSYGLPCLVTEGTTLKKIIEDNGAGWGAETSSDSVSEAIEQCVKSRSILENISACAQKLAADTFEWNSIAKETLLLYHSNLSKK